MSIIINHDDQDLTFITCFETSTFELSTGRNILTFRFLPNNILSPIFMRARLSNNKKQNIQDKKD